MSAMIDFLLCATDAGGARNLAPLVGLFLGRGLKGAIFASGVSAPFLDNEGLNIEIPSVATIDDAARHLSQKKPLVVICGTARDGSVERFIIAAAKQALIRSVVVLDEWFHYRLRFADEYGNLTYLPDIICCQDELAKKEAEREGIPGRILRITGSPSLARLAALGERFTLEPPAVSDVIRGPGNLPVVTYLSETHAADYGNAPGEHGPLGSFLGYTEDTVREEIIGVLKESCMPIMFVEKLHPAQREFNCRKTQEGNIAFVVVRDIDVWSLMWHSAFVIGMRSMGLLESVILRRPAVSFQPGLTGPQLCSAVRLGLIPCALSRQELKGWCFQQLKTGGSFSGDRRIQDFPFTRKDAAENVVNLVQETVKELP